ncbi:hypothetical protein IWQ61_004243 [Dispira simplex]|nr:hypothetical protein IWQ61_004243 [Dispira simplex]
MMPHSHRNSCVEPTPDSTIFSRARANSSRLSLPPFFRWHRTSKDGSEQGSAQVTDVRSLAGNITTNTTHDPHFRRHQVMSQDYLTEQRQFAQTLRAFPMPVTQNETTGSDIHMANPVCGAKVDFPFQRLAPPVDPSSPTSTLTLSSKVLAPTTEGNPACNDHWANMRGCRVSSGNSGSDTLCRTQLENSSPQRGGGSPPSQRKSLASMRVYVQDGSPADTVRASSYVPGKTSALEKGDLKDFTDNAPQRRVTFRHWGVFVGLWIALIASLVFMWLAVQNKPALIAIPIIVALAVAGSLVWFYKKYIFHLLSGGGLFVFPMNPQGAFPAATLPTHANHHQPPTASPNRSALAMPTPALHNGQSYALSTSGSTLTGYGPSTMVTTTTVRAGEHLSHHSTDGDRPTGAAVSTDNSLLMQLPPPSYQQAVEAPPLYQPLKRSG